MSCRHVSATGYRCSRPPLPAHRGFCRQHASQLQLPPPSQPSRRGGRGGGSVAVVPATPAPAVPHAAPDVSARRRSSSVGRIPTVEQLLSRIDRLRASSPSAESAWSEDSDHETPTLGSSRQYAGSGCAGDSSSAESGGEGPETVEALSRAGVYTAEEAALVSRDKLVRQQALYIQQFSRLQHLLREGRRRYLHELKLEREAEAEAAKERQLAAEAGEDDAERGLEAVAGRSGGRGAAPRNQHDAEEKLRAAWRYHRHRGLSQVMRRRAWDRRSDTPAPPGPRCVHTEGGVRCSERCLPGSKFCVRHILSDPHQMLFVPCAGRRSLTLQQRDEEFSRSRRKARRTATAAAAASRGSGASTSRPPAPVSSRTSARACARGTNPAVAAVLAARGRARPRAAPTPARTTARAPPPPPAPPAAGRRRAVVGVVAPIPRSHEAARAVAARAGTRASTNTSANAITSAGGSTGGGAGGSTGGGAGGTTGGTRPARAPTAVKSEAPAPAQAAPAPSTAGKPWSAESVDMKALQRGLNTKTAKDIIAAVRSQDAAAFAAALGMEKTPSVEKMMQRRTVARMVDAMERGDAEALIAARMAADKPFSPEETARVMGKARKIAARVSVLQSEEAVRLVAGLTSNDPAVIFAALKSKDSVAVAAALRARAAAGPSAARGLGVPPAQSRNPAKVPAGAAVGVPATRPARMVDAMERGDVDALIAARMAADKPISPAETARVMEEARKIAARASVLQSEEAVRLVAGLTSKDPAVVFAALKSKDSVAVAAALKARAVAGPSAARGPRVPPAQSRNPAKVPAGATVGVPATRPAGPANVPGRTAPAWPSTASQHPEAIALLATLNTTDRAAVWAALRAKDTEALKKILKSESVAPIMADLKAKGLIGTRKTAKSEAEAKAAKSDAPTPAAPAGPPVPPTAARPAPVAATRRPGDVAASSSAVRSEDAHGTVPVKSANGAAPAAAPKSGNACASTAAPKSGKPAAPSVALGAAMTAVSQKPTTTAGRGVALEGKVAAAVRTKSAAAKAAAAKLKAAATTLAARKAKKRAQCQEPVLCVFEADMRCPWHTVVPDVRFPAEGDAAVPKVEVKEEGPDEPEGFPPATKKIKMELDQLTPDIGCIVGEVEMKLGSLRLSQMETNDDAADDTASVSGSGNQADLSTESTLSATSPRADDDDEMDVDVEAGEVMLQPPLGADDADLVAVAQGVAVVGAHEEVAQDDDSLTNPPAAVDEVEVS